jgi:hypothetical protein
MPKFSRNSLTFHRLGESYHDQMQGKKILPFCGHAVIVCLIPFLHPPIRFLLSTYKLATLDEL